MKKTKWYNSTRLWTAIISAIGVTVIHFYPGTEKLVLSLTGIAMSYIFGKSYSDGKRLEGVTTPPPDEVC